MAWDFNPKQRSVDVHQFAMVPRADIPRSAFDRQWAHKSTFDEGYLIPVYVDEVLPGDSFSLSATMFARMSTPIYPIMDNMTLESFFFFVPARLVWSHFVNMMGEQANPADTISYTVPYADSPVDGYLVGTLQDYMGLPTKGQVVAGDKSRANNLPMRAYNLIWNQWFRDENLQNSVTVDLGDGPDTYSNYVLLRRGKRKDYFTSALPWTQKGSTAVSLPLGTSAPIVSLGTGPTFKQSDNNHDLGFMPTPGVGTTGPLAVTNAANTAGPSNMVWNVVGLQADLSTATAATINQLRLAFQTQRLLERDARGGTRYVELLRSHWGVVNPDFRLQRPEYLGGGSTPIVVSPVAQTSGTSASGTTTPMGTLGAVATVLAHGHGFTQSFTEHGYIIGMVAIRADLTYQQGQRRLWNRSTRYDFYVPAFATLGEQAILNKEIYYQGLAQGSPVTDEQAFGYIERWAEYRYFPSMITGQFRSTYTTPLDAWHLSQKFTSLPTLNTTFIQDTPPVSRVVAVSSAGAHFIFDSFFRCRTVRAMPMYSVPGLIDHF